MAQWVEFDATSSPFIQASSLLLDSTKILLTGAAALATASAAAMQAAALFGAYTVSLDPQAALIAALKAGVDALITDLVTTGLFILVIQPDVRGNRQRGLDGYIRTVKNAFNDVGDLNRPNRGPGADSDGILFLISSESLDELALAAEGFQILFDTAWQELIDIVAHSSLTTPNLVVERIGEVTALVPGTDPKVVFVDSTQTDFIANPTLDPFKGQTMRMLTGRNADLSARVGSFDGETLTFTMDPPFRYELQIGDTYVLSFVTAPSPPDWRSLRLVDHIPVVAEVTEILADLSAALPATGMSAFQQKLIAALELKADRYNELEQRIDDVVALFDAFSNVPTINMLSITSDQGDNGFMQQVFSASDPPAIGSNDFTLGIVLYGGSGVLNTLSKIFPI